MPKHANLARALQESSVLLDELVSRDVLDGVTRHLQDTGSEMSKAKDFQIFEKKAMEVNQQNGRPHAVQ